MRQKLSLSVVLCVVCLFSAKAQTVSESESKIIFNKTAAGILPVIENPKKTALRHQRSNDFFGHLRLLQRRSQSDACAVEI